MRDEDATIDPRLEITAAGVAVVTDLGRASGPTVGLPVNGALDQRSARVANLLVGNDEGAALIEITAFDFACRASVDALIAVTGAPMTLRVDGVERESWQPIWVPAGTEISLTGMTRGMRAYVAVAGSFDAPELFGSVAPDTVVGFGTVLAAGSSVALRAAAPSIDNPYFDATLVRVGVSAPPFGDGEWVIEVTDGPDLADFGDTAERLFAGPFVVGAKSNHIGLRLGGQPLPERVSIDEKVSRGVPIGAIEVPKGDELLVLHRGRGVTAGYPVLAVVTPTSLDRLAQARPGDRVVFRRVDLARASRAARHERDELDAIGHRVAVVFASLEGLRTLHPASERTPS